MTGLENSLVDIAIKPDARDLDNLRSASEILDRWIEDEQFAGWDPHDLLNSPFLRPLATPTSWGYFIGIAAVQFGRRSPWNLRGPLHVPKMRNAKAVGLFLASYSRKYALRQSHETLHFLEEMVKWLEETGNRSYGGIGWGYPFPWASRSFFLTRGEPTSVNTSFIVMGLLDAYEFAGITRALELAKEAGEFLAHGLNRYQQAEEICFSYTPRDKRWVHNANALVAGALARLGNTLGHSEWVDLARSAAFYTANRQRPDGSWPYGEGLRYRWVDNFHTGYVLDALQDIAHWAGEPRLLSVVQRGYDYWKEHFFREDGAPRFAVNSTYPIDVHCAAQATLTFSRHRSYDPEGSTLAISCAQWAVNNMQTPQGWFVYQLYPHYTIRIPYMRWSQAWMQRALTELEFSLLTEP